MRTEPGRADVMIGDQVAGTAAVPQWAFETLTSIKIMKKNRVAHGELDVKKRKDGSVRVKALNIDLPEVEAPG